MSTKSTSKNAEIFNCIICHVTCSKRSNYNLHLLTARHKTSTEKAQKEAQKNAEIFNCTICHFKSCKKCNYDSHLLTAKHKKSTETATNPLVKNAEIFSCVVCHVICRRRSKYNSHLLTAKHKKATETAIKNAEKGAEKTAEKNAVIFNYIDEPVICSKTDQCNSHLLTAEYEKSTKTATNQPVKNAEIFNCIECDVTPSKIERCNSHELTSKPKKSTEKSQKNAESYCCECCGKTYGGRSGLWRHKKTCAPQAAEHLHIPNSDVSLNVILEIVKQNQEFKEILIEQNKENKKLQEQLLEITKDGKIINNSNNYNNNNYNNNTTNNNFNLQLFLNETCKDALNIEDFVNQISLQVSDLDMIGKVGYVEGITSIFLRNLKDMDICKRPIHCSDLKRETLYVKDKDAWEKENRENIKINKAIKGIEHKNIQQLPRWKKENPEVDNYDSETHLDYHKIIIESMGGASSEDDCKKREKIIRNIAKETVIEK